MIKAYYKLVRDKIPNILKKQGLKCTTKILNEKEFGYYLELKLKEKVVDLMQRNKKEKIIEIATLYDVLNYLVKYYKISTRDLQKIQIKKRKERGGFDKKIFLVLTEE